MPGVLTPATAPPICLSLPLWEQADLYVVKRGIIEGKTSQQ